MTRRLLLSYVSITTFVVLVLEIPLGVTFARSERRNLVDRVKHDAIALTLLGEERLEGGAPGTDLRRMVADYRARDGGPSRVRRPNRQGAGILGAGVRRQSGLRQPARDPGRTRGARGLGSTALDEPRRGPAIRSRSRELGRASARRGGA